MPSQFPPHVASVWILGALLLCASAVADPAHVHGKGELAVAVDGDTLTLALEVPLDALIGFERVPRTEKEKAAWRDMEKTLSDSAALFQPTAEAGCAPAERRLSLPFGPGSGGDGHADVDAEYVFKCARPAALKGFSTTLFQRFPRLYRIEAKRAGPRGQGAGRLVPKQPSLTW